MKRNYKYIKLEERTEEEFVLCRQKFKMIHNPSDKTDKRDRDEVMRGNERQVRFLEKTLRTNLHAEFRQDIKNRLWLVRDLHPGLGDEHIPVFTPKVKKKERV